MEVMNNNSTETVGEVLRIKEVLLNSEHQSEDEVYESLQKLQVLVLSKDILEVTKIGKVVNEIRKKVGSKSKRIRQLGHSLIEGWKAIVDKWLNDTKDEEEEEEEEKGGLSCPPMENDLFLTSLMNINPDYHDTTSEDLSKLFEGLDNGGVDLESIERLKPATVLKRKHAGKQIRLLTPPPDRGQDVSIKHIIKSAPLERKSAGKQIRLLTPPPDRGQDGPEKASLRIRLKITPKKQTTSESKDLESIERLKPATLERKSAGKQIRLLTPDRGQDLFEGLDNDGDLESIERLKPATVLKRKHAGKQIRLLTPDRGQDVSPKKVSLRIRLKITPKNQTTAESTEKQPRINLLQKPKEDDDEMKSLTSNKDDKKQEEMVTPDQKGSLLTSISPNFLDDDSALQIKLEAAKRKLHDGYQLAENAKKRRTIKFVDPKDLPPQCLYNGRRHCRKQPRIQVKLRRFIH